MIPWKKKQPPQPQIQHHVNQQLLYGTMDGVKALKKQNADLIERIAKLEAQPSITLYKLDPQEDVLVQCVVGDERVCVPLSQVIAHVVPEITAQVEQAMVTKVRLTGMPRSRT